MSPLAAESKYQSVGQPLQQHQSDLEVSRFLFEQKEHEYPKSCFTQGINVFLILLRSKISEKLRYFQV